MTPRFDEVGVELEPHDITFIQDIYMENCRVFARLPITPETSSSELLPISLEQAKDLRHAATIGALSLHLSKPKTVMERIKQPFGIRKAEEGISDIMAFNNTLDENLQASRQHSSTQQVV